MAAIRHFVGKPVRLYSVPYSSFNQRKIHENRLRITQYTHKNFFFLKNPRWRLSDILLWNLSDIISSHFHSPLKQKKIHEIRLRITQYTQKKNIFLKKLNMATVGHFVGKPGLTLYLSYNLDSPSQKTKFMKIN